MKFLSCRLAAFIDWSRVVLFQQVVLPSYLIVEVLFFPEICKDVGIGLILKTANFLIH